MIKYIPTYLLFSNEPELEFSSSSRAMKVPKGAKPSWGTFVSELKICMYVKKYQILDLFLPSYQKFLSKKTTSKYVLLSWPNPYVLVLLYCLRVQIFQPAYFFMNWSTRLRFWKWKISPIGKWKKSLVLCQFSSLKREIPELNIYLFQKYF